MEAKNEQSAIPCEICKSKDSLYRCPACFTRTCSLPCCLAHKEKHECNGTRDRTAFVPLNKFSNSTLASDFHFLEDVLTRSDRGKRLIKDLGLNASAGAGGNKRKRPEEENAPEDIPMHPLSQLQLASTSVDLDQDTNANANAVEDEKHKRIKSLVPVQVCDGIMDNASDKVQATPPTTTTSTRSDPILTQYPKHKQQLVQKARERKVHLLLMPPGMQRHMMNKTTKYDSKKDIIYWKVEFIFHIKLKGDTKRTKTVLTIDRVPETDVLYKHLSNAFEKQVSHSAPSDTRSILTNFRQTTNELKSDIATLMKRIPSKSSQPTYNKVDLKQSLREMLNGLAVIEFPTIEIVLQEDAELFSLMIAEL